MCVALNGSSFLGKKKGDVMEGEAVIWKRKGVQIYYRTSYCTSKKVLHNLSEPLSWL